MNKVAHYLQEHLTGEVITSPETRRFFSTDASILTLTPSVICYPANESDVRKTARFTWQLAERGRVIPITARGGGSDQGGAAIGEGIMMVFPAHMNRILELDSKSGAVIVEPGINYGRLQQTLFTHARFLPPSPSSLDYSTIGGALANNASGEKSIKYGDTRKFAKALRVVLANGEIIETRRLSKRELNKKLGLATFEGEVYRSIDTLIEENHDLITKIDLSTGKNAAGYALNEIKRKDSSFDLTPLFVGSQGTLGIITEATLSTETHNPNTTLLVALVDDLQISEELIIELRKFGDTPCAIEAVDRNLLEYVQARNPNYLKGVVSPPFPKVALLIEFDTLNERQQKRLAKKAAKMFDKYQINYRLETDHEQKVLLQKLRGGSSIVLSGGDSREAALPFIGDGAVPLERLREYMDSAYKLFAHYQVPVVMWGHVGDGNLHFQPLLDLGQVGDRQKIFRLYDEYYKLVIAIGGTTTAQQNDGRIRAPLLTQLFGEDIYALFQKTKQIFDPYGTLNAGVKIGTTMEQLRPLLRSEYSLKNLSTYLPKG